MDYIEMITDVGMRQAKGMDLPDSVRTETAIFENSIIQDTLYLKYGIKLPTALQAIMSEQIPADPDVQAHQLSHNMRRQKLDQFIQASA